ncbi:MAG: hypothetical protein IJW70_03905 [Clostridia bacterium]|nr:hypothetical protein [Clostridia bacterium]
MVYKIEGVKDLAMLPPMDDDVKAIIHHHAKILTELYGNSPLYGGYVLYAAPGTNSKTLLAYFDYQHNIAEYVDRISDFYVATFVTNNENVVVIVASVDDAPAEIVKELDDIL